MSAASRAKVIAWLEDKPSTASCVHVHVLAELLDAFGQELRHFLDFTVRSWLSEDAHGQCDVARCSHAKALAERYEALEAMVQ